MEKNITPWAALTIPQKVDAIRAAYPHTRHTAESIAVYIGNELQCSVSRGSIIGFYNRAAIALQEYPLEGRNYGGTPIKRRLAALAARVDRLIEPATSENRKNEMPSGVFEPKPLLRNTVNLRARDCRWIVDGIGEAALYCCAPSPVGQSYCAYHKARSLGKGTEGERTALNTLLKSA